MINKKTDNLLQKVIFTDCFNTLLGRVCSPNDMIFKWCDIADTKYDKMYGLLYSCTQAKSQIFNEFWGAGREVLIDIMQSSNCGKDADLQNLIAQKFDEIMRVDDEFYSEIDSICAYVHAKMIQILLKCNNNFLLKTNKNCRKQSKLRQKDIKLLSQKLKIFKKSRLFWP